MVTELPNVNLRFAIERQGALPGRTSLLINRQSTNANRKSFIQPGAKPAAKKPIRHGAWLTEVVKQRRPETATFPCGKPSRAALGEPSPEIYSTAGRDSSANIGDFPLQNALNNRKRGICASRVGSTGTKPDRVGSACSDRICGEKRGGDRPWSSPRWIGVPGGGSPSVTGPARTGKVPSHTSVSGAGLPEAQSTGPAGAAAAVGFRGICDVTKCSPVQPAITILPPENAPPRCACHSPTLFVAAAYPLAAAIDSSFRSRLFRRVFASVHIASSSRTPFSTPTELSHESTRSTMSLNGNRRTKWSNKNHLVNSANLISNLLKFPLNYLAEGLSCHWRLGDYTR